MAEGRPVPFLVRIFCETKDPNTKCRGRKVEWKSKPKIDIYDTRISKETAQNLEEGEHYLKHQFCRGVSGKSLPWRQPL